MCSAENGDGSAPASDGPVARDLVDLQTLDGHGDVVCGDVKGGDLVVWWLRTYWVSPAGRYRGRSVVSWGLEQGLHRAAETRQCPSGPGMSLGRSRYSNLAARERQSGVESEGEGPTAQILKGPVQLSDNFSLRTLASVPDLPPWRMVAAVL